MIGREIISLKRISLHDRICSVSYDIDGEIATETVKFSFLNGEEWF